MILKIFLLVLLAWTLPTYIAHRLGLWKGRESGVFFGLLLGWLGVVLLALTPRATRVCPDCGERTRHDASVCWRCGYRFGSLAET